ncbi:MAG: hypothetical protein LBB27_03015 [Tannerellaceae bacterium]|jgi:hypothetical protein|nr:hypothetical protein [Tannerellaceae bacterium]
MSDNGYGHESISSEEEKKFRAGDTVGRSTILYILDSGDVAMRCNVCFTVYDTTLAVLRKGETDTCGDCKPYESGLRNKKPMKPVKPAKPVKPEKAVAPARRYNYAGTGFSRKEISDQFKVSTTLVDLRHKDYLQSDERAAGILFLDYLAGNLYKRSNCTPSNAYGTGKTLAQLADQFDYPISHLSTMYHRYMRLKGKYGTFLEYMEHCHRVRLQMSRKTETIE